MKWVTLTGGIGQVTKEGGTAEPGDSAEPRPFVAEQQARDEGRRDGGTPQPQHRWQQVPAQVDLPAIERDVLEHWAEQDTFAKSLAQSADGQPWTFYEGPPTANGMPGTHHIEARVFKDVFPRYRTMKGFSVERKAGWDCHGLPVEVAVEKELGFNGKKDIEAYGIAEFNAEVP